MDAAIPAPTEITVIRGPIRFTFLACSLPLTVLIEESEPESAEPSAEIPRVPIGFAPPADSNTQP